MGVLSITDVQWLIVTIIICNKSRKYSRVRAIELKVVKDLTR